MKDRVLTDWTNITKSESPRTATRPGQRNAEGTTAGRSRLEEKFAALDAAFEIRDEAEVIDDVRDWLFDEEVTTPDEAAGSMAEDALVAAFGV
jgi:hypothetical protein